jgi:hypothetical protein
VDLDDFDPAYCVPAEAEHREGEPYLLDRHRARETVSSEYDLLVALDEEEDRAQAQRAGQVAGGTAQLVQLSGRRWKAAVHPYDHVVPAHTADDAPAAAEPPGSTR